MSDRLTELIRRLRIGVPMKPSRWSGDTHADDGGEYEIEQADALMMDAADALTEVQASRKLIADLRTWLTRMDGGRCERTTGGGFYCLGDGYTPDAPAGVNRSCESCNAHQAIRMIDEAGL